MKLLLVLRLGKMGLADNQISPASAYSVCFAPDGRPHGLHSAKTTREAASMPKNYLADWLKKTQIKKAALQPLSFINAVCGFCRCLLRYSVPFQHLG